MSTQEKRTITVEIAGSRFRLSSDADEAHLQHLADIVNQRIASLGGRAAQRATPAQVLALVVLSFAEDLEVAEERYRKLASKTRKVVNEAIEQIDRRLREDAAAGTS